jgi:hypothetical protein
VRVGDVVGLWSGGLGLVVRSERFGTRDVDCGEKVLVFTDSRLKCPTMERLIDIVAGGGEPKRPGMWPRM